MQNAEASGDELNFVVKFVLLSYLVMVKKSCACGAKQNETMRNGSCMVRV